MQICQFFFDFFEISFYLEIVSFLQYTVDERSNQLKKMREMILR